MKILDLDESERPRERFKRLGANALSNAELLAIILRTGSKKENVVSLSQRILSIYPLEKIADLSLKELCSINGIGEAKALQIKAIFSLVNRKKSSKIKKISSPKDVFEYFAEVRELKQEHFYVLHLNSKNEIISSKLIAIGTLNSVIIHPREVFKEAIRESAQSIILVHNHPSGDVTPSLQDKEITSKLEKTSETIGIDLLDHIIVGKEKWFSFDDEGKL
jgi:DNA repair protein RadC